MNQVGDKIRKDRDMFTKLKYKMIESEAQRKLERAALVRADEERIIMQNNIKKIEKVERGKKGYTSKFDIKQKELG